MGFVAVGTQGLTWSTLDLAEAHRLYVDGMSCAAVGRELGFTKSYIATRFRRAGLPMRPSGRPLPTPAPDVDPREIVRLREAGATWLAIAEQLGLSRDSARDRYLQATGRVRRRLRQTSTPQADSAA